MSAIAHRPQRCVATLASGRVMHAATRVRSFIDAARQNILDAGRALSVAKATLERGEWADLLDELGMGASTAYAYIQVAETFDVAHMTAHHRSIFLRIDPSGLIALAREDRNGQATTLAMREAETTGHASHAFVRRAIAQTNGKKRRPKELDCHRRQRIARTVECWLMHWPACPQSAALMRQALDLIAPV